MSLFGTTVHAKRLFAVHPFSNVSDNAALVTVTIVVFPITNLVGIKEKTKFESC
jgi:hypothetical protein